MKKAKLGRRLALDRESLHRLDSSILGGAETGINCPIPSHHGSCPTLCTMTRVTCPPPTTTC